MTPEEIELMNADLKKQEETNSFGRWNWFAIVEKLADGDVTKFDAVCEQNFVLCLNLLSYWKERDEYTTKLRNQAQQKITNKTYN